MALDIEPATEEAIASLLAEMPSWTRDGNALVRVESFVKYAEALDFVHRVGLLAEEKNHHPDLLLHYRKATVRYWTHKIGGISRGDIAMARAVEALRATLPYATATPPTTATQPGATPKG